MRLIRDWFSRTFNDPQVVVLGVVLLLGFGVVLFMGNMLAPVLASLVLAYLLEGFVRYLERWRVPRLAAVTVVFLAFTAFLFALFLILFPVLYRQLVQLVEQLPAILAQGQSVLLQLPEHYPQLFSEAQMREIINGLRRELVDWAQRIVTSFSFQSVVVVITLLVYMVLVPFMVFFFLKDKRLMLQWLSDHLPRERGLASEVWREVDLQIGNYVRGKFVEILIVWAVTFITFSLFGLQFAMLLAVMVGLSVIVPYVGAAVVTLPVAIIAYFQWGLSPEFAWLMVAYFVIQALDGNVLVPLLFSEAVNLHPVAIIVAILVFGGLWGFWGVFFAIPLATLIQAVIKAWPRTAQTAVDRA
ncbi:putative permease [Alkalispirillum mobile]|uniref:Putative permease n=1 Tax=Alkalispirillum mobile TaxID=85925 RepID=A0A498BZ91_9GAMM|nr:AI-2E family transporter [Alkalispirillum mobile]RLK48253.1 putative permease [Alkalispirillum mobile]